MTERPDIRRATLEDVPDITRLSHQWGYPVEAETVRQRLAGLLGRSDHLVLVADAASLAGWVAAERRRTLAFDTRVELTGLVVDERHRREGIGRALLAAVEAWAAGQGIDTVFLRSNIVRPEAHDFYPGLGYRRIKTQHVYVKSLETS